jgi:hypothetical protein
MRKVAR